jgi:hypothetical protein
MATLETWSVSDESAVAIAASLARRERQPDDESGPTQTVFTRLDGDNALMPLDDRPRNGEP